MKKLMIATLGLAAAGSVFGAPQVFDYKASVKHMYLKEVKIKTADFNGIVYQKYAKSASLKGYLIMDVDGVTSPTITENRVDSDDRPAVSTATAFDYGRNRGFLVVQNSKAESKVRAPKILPAVLDAKWVDTQLKKSHKASSGLAEGTLFVGGDSIATVRKQLDVRPVDVEGVMVEDITERTVAPATPAAKTPGMSAYADYVWTSVYLFGQFNGPNWFKTGAVSSFDEFETAWDGNLPDTLQRGQDAKPNFFHDTWMNGAGIGKYAVPTWTDGDLCCGLTPDSGSEIVLDTLTGNLKGGLFICTENGVDAKASTYRWFDGDAWEDQFNCARLTSGGSFNVAWLNDMWNDGAVEQQTTDVVYGSWSIKWNRKFYNTKGGVAKDLTDEEVVLIEPALDTLPLWGAIKGAALKLNKSATVYDKSEIYTKTDKTRFNLPVVTPQLAKHYGLINQ